MAELRCQGCGGPLTLRGGTDDKVILPTVRVSLEPTGDPRALGRVTGVEGGPWCADCIRGWDDRMGASPDTDEPIG